jgi:tryptophan aminotransferase
VRACLCVVTGSIIERRRRFKLCLKAGNEDSAAVIRTKAFEKGVLALPGTVFLPNGRTTAYVRASFSVVEEADVEEAVKRLRAAVLE